MTEFDKDFPSLQGRLCNRPNVKRFCIDKAKLKETLAGGYSSIYPNTDEEEYWIKVDRKKWNELGLDDTN